MAADSPCSADGCDSVVGRSGAKGFCPRHYKCFRATGDPLVSAGDIARSPKPCPVCGETYSPNNSLSKSCPPCRAQIKTEYDREWNIRNPGYSTEANRRLRAADPEGHRAYGARYRAENRDAIRARYADWEARNPRHAQEWVERNKERARENVRRYRTRKRGVPTFEVTEKDLRRMIARHGGRCAYCADVLGDDYHVDHVVPVSQGGSNGIGNLAPACPSCNISKNGWFLSEWRYRERLSSPLKRRRSTFDRVA